MRFPDITALILASLIGSTVLAEVHVVETPDGGKVPDAEVDSRGNVHLTYVHDDNVYYTTSADDGRTFADPIRVNTEPGFAYGGAFRGPDLELGRDWIHIVWYNAGYQQKRPQDEWGVMYARMPSGGDSFPPARNLNRRPSDNYSLAADRQGRVAVMWMAGGVYANLSDDEGKHFSEPVDLQTDPCECCASRATFTDAGGLAVLYRDKAQNDRDMFLAVRPPRANAFQHVQISQTPWLIDLCPMSGCFLDANPAGLTAAWETKGRIYFGRFDAAARYLDAGEILVARQGRYPVARTARDGRALVAWKDGKTLTWQLFDAMGQAVGEPGSHACQHADRPAGVVTDQGNFLLFP